MPFTKNCCTKTTDTFEKSMEALRKAIELAESVVIGAGAGLSAAAGLDYGGARFRKNFPDFIEKYNLPDMYSATFYPFGTEEERWAYLSRHILLNRFENGTALPLYRKLLQTVGGKEHFVITTNVDGLFAKAGFAEERIFAVQGDYGLLQCGHACHDKLYPDESLVRQMVEQTGDCRIPSELVPHCPVCGGKMEIHIRKDGYFIEDAEWRASLERYSAFMENALKGRVLLLEIGVGFNTPSIIRFPFENLSSRNRNVTLARLNRDFPEAQLRPISFIPFGEDIARTIKEI